MQPAQTRLVSFDARTANLGDGALALQVDAADAEEACTLTITMQAPGGR